NRCLRVCDNSNGLLVERWHGRETLSQGVAWWIDLLATDATLDLEAWLGQPAKLITRLAGGSDCMRSGLVREASCIGSDGGLARYRLCLVPWTWLLTQGRHSRVFQDRSVVDIVEAVFADYAPLAAWQLGDEVGPFLGDRQRSYCVQYRESDFDFVSRLLAEEGLGWRLEEDDEAAAGHRLVLFADSAAQREDGLSSAGGGIRFHRSDATESSDSVQAFGRRRRIGADRLTVLGHDYKTGQASTAQLPLQAGFEPPSPLEAYDPGGAYAFASAAEADRYAGLMAQAREAAEAGWFGRGTARSFRAGTWFRLTQAPTAPGADAPPTEILLTGVQHLGINNLPLDAREHVAGQLGAAPAWPADPLSELDATALQDRAEAIGYANAFTAVDRELPWRPVLADGTGARPNPRPTAPGYQTALVVGPEGSTSAAGSQELYCDQFGRVRVKFHFQQAREPGDRDSCWLRVAQRYAGPGVGSQFLPRIGQEV